MKRTGLSIVMPVYNEEEVIARVVRTYYDEIILKIDDSEFIVVDDCSRDNTHNILDKLKKQLPRLKVLKTPVNGGHGRTIRMGYEAAEKADVFQVDSDNQFEPGDFWKLYALKDDYDFILGFRKVRLDPSTRQVLTKIVRTMNFIFFGVWIKDANCPFRLIKKTVLNRLFERFIDREVGAPNIMISILAKKQSITMTEIPVTHYRRKTGMVSMVSWRLIRFSLRGFKELLILRKRMLFG